MTLWLASAVAVFAMSVVVLVYVIDDRCITHQFAKWEQFTVTHKYQHNDHRTTPPTLYGEDIKHVAMQLRRCRRCNYEQREEVQRA